MWIITATKDYYNVQFKKLRRTETIKKIQAEDVKECQNRLIGKCPDQEFFNIIRNEFFIHLLQNIQDNMCILIKKINTFNNSYKLELYQKDRFKYTTLNKYIIRI